MKERKVLCMNCEVGAGDVDAIAGAIECIRSVAESKNDGRVHRQLEGVSKLAWALIRTGRSVARCRILMSAGDIKVGIGLAAAARSVASDTEELRGLRIVETMLWDFQDVGRKAAAEGGPN